MPEQDIRILGGRWAPDFGFVQLHKRLKVGGQWYSDTGIGDLIFAPINLFYRWGDLHTLLCVDFIAPTGDYDRKRVVKLGNNHWTIKPAALLTYARPKWEITGIFNVDFNTKNPGYIDPLTRLETSHRSGTSFHMDYAASWRPTPRWNLGISGYYVDDLEDDRVGGQRVQGTQTRAFAIGPGVRYQWGPVGLVAKWQHEVVAENRPQGVFFWLRFILPL